MRRLEQRSACLRRHHRRRWQVRNDARDVGVLKRDAQCRRGRRRRKGPDGGKVRWRGLAAVGLRRRGRERIVDAALGEGCGTNGEGEEREVLRGLAWEECDGRRGLCVSQDIKNKKQTSNLCGPGWEVLVACALRCLYQPRNYDKW